MNDDSMPQACTGSALFANRRRSSYGMGCGLVAKVLSPPFRSFLSLFDFD